MTYVSLNRYACFAEVFGNAGLIPADAAARYLSQMMTSRPLRLLNLNDEAIWPRFGLDGTINTDPDYALTQPWSKAWHDWYPDMDGIQYPGRRAGQKLNCCLFLDRCASDVSFARLGTLRDLARTVALAAERYGLDNLVTP